ncbi:MAG: hypothetical protein HY646_09640 [Acidobacteria bacterium]|nr:hypothetical protein [Acidobacteriota bacterium]
MTPEERFERIEQALQRSAELHAEHAELLRRHAEQVQICGLTISRLTRDGEAPSRWTATLQTQPVKPLPKRSGHSGSATSARWPACRRPVRTEPSLGRRRNVSRWKRVISSLN